MAQMFQIWEEKPRGPGRVAPRLAARARPIHRPRLGPSSRQAKDDCLQERRPRRPGTVAKARSRREWGQGAVRRRWASHGPFFAPEPGAGLGSALGITDGTRSRCGKIARSWLETQYV